VVFINETVIAHETLLEWQMIVCRMLQVPQDHVRIKVGKGGPFEAEMSVAVPRSQIAALMAKGMNSIEADSAIAQTVKGAIGATQDRFRQMLSMRLHLWRKSACQSRSTKVG